jgi:hypothetical protein
MVVAELEGEDGILSTHSRDNMAAVLIQERANGLPSDQFPWYLDERFLRRFVMPVDVFYTVNTWFGKVIHDTWAVLSLSFLVTSVAEYKQINNIASLIASWHIIESYLRMKYGESRTETSVGTTTRPPNIARVIDELHRGGGISIDLRERIDHIREYRNAYMHNETYWCDEEVSHAAIEIGLIFIQERTGLALEPGLGHKVRCL